jgi:hypothetical protein
VVCRAAIVRVKLEGVTEDAGCLWKMYITLVLISNTTVLKTTALAITGQNSNFTVKVL